MEQYVVTVSMEYAFTLPGEAAVSVMQVFEGEEDACRRVARGIAGAYNDRRRIKSTSVSCGSLKDWLEFLEEMSG